MRKRQKIVRSLINYDGNERVNNWLNKGWKVRGYVKMDKEFIDYILELEEDNVEKTYITPGHSSMSLNQKERDRKISPGNMYP